MGREPAVVVSAAVAEAIARPRVAEARHEHDVGHHRRPARRGNAAFVAHCRRGAVPRAVVHLAPRFLRVGKREINGIEISVAKAGERCVKFGSKRPIQAQSLGLQFRQHVTQMPGQRGLRGVPRRRREQIAQPVQPFAQLAAGGRCGVGGRRERHSRQEASRLKTCSSVYGRVLRRLALLVGCALVIPSCAYAQATSDPVVDAREAFRKKDKSRLAADRAAALAAQHPLAMWADYWDLSNRIAEVSQDEVDAFYKRWSGSYVEDRLRNDWLLELGHRHDWAGFSADYPRFRMNDDREVTCYAVLTRHLDGKDVRDAARAAWFAQRDADEGCALLAATLLDAKVIGTADAWRKTRLSMDAGRVRAARQASALVSLNAATQVQELADSPARFLTRKATAGGGRLNAELTTLALMRMAGNDPD